MVFSLSPDTAKYSCEKPYFRLNFGYNIPQPLPPLSLFAKILSRSLENLKIIRNGFAFLHALSL